MLYTLFILGTLIGGPTVDMNPNGYGARVF